VLAHLTVARGEITDDPLRLVGQFKPARRLACARRFLRSAATCAPGG